MRRVMLVSIGPYASVEHMELVLMRAGVALREGEIDRDRFVPRPTGFGDRKYYETGYYGWFGEFRCDDRRWRVLRRQLGETARVVERAYYTKEEIEAAEMLFLERRVETMQSRGETGPEHGNEYDYSQACPRCLSGATLIPPLRVRESDLPKKRPIAETYAREFLVTGRVAEALRGIPGSDRWLVPVEARRSKKLLPWLAIQPEATMPPVHPSIGPSDDPDTCPLCRRTNWSSRTIRDNDEGIAIAEPQHLIYTRAEVEEACRPWIQPGESLPDVAGTWERYGCGSAPGGGPRRVAQPYILVSRRVGRLLRETAGKWVDFALVSFVD